MTIHNRELPSGTVLTAKFKKQAYSCTVEVDGEGKRTYVIGDKRFTSPSSAASSITGGAINGWAFWSVEGEAAEPKAEKASKREAKAKPEKQAKAKAERKPRAKKFRLFEPTPEGGFWCHACQKPFDSADTQPEACPEGHRADDPELTSAPAPEAVQAETEPVAVEA